ncbi:MAG: hypothetical protein WAM65_10860 [Candidatus Korobacteraceae bacterium]
MHNMNLNPYSYHSQEKDGKRFCEDIAKKFSSGLACPVKSERAPEGTENPAAFLAAADSLRLAREFSARLLNSIRDLKHAAGGMYADAIDVSCRRHNGHIEFRTGDAGQH